MFYTNTMYYTYHIFISSFANFLLLTSMFCLFFFQTSHFFFRITSLSSNHCTDWHYVKKYFLFSVLSLIQSDSLNDHDCNDGEREKNLPYLFFLFLARFYILYLNYVFLYLHFSWSWKVPKVLFFSSCDRFHAPDNFGYISTTCTSIFIISFLKCCTQN